MIDQLIYIIYILTGAFAFFFTQYSSNYFKRAAGLILFLYQIPLFVKSFEFDYFGTLISVDFTTIHYAAAILFNFCIILILNINLSTAIAHGSENLKGFYRFLLYLSFVAFVVDVLFNRDYYLYDKALRFSSEVQKIPNLLVIDIDWLIIFLSFGIVVFIKGLRFFGAALVFFCAGLGVVLGMRYYAVIPALFIFLEVTNRSKKIYRPVYALLLLLFMPFGAAVLDSLKAYVAFYEWVGDKTFIAYFLDNNISLFTGGEIGAIGSNLFIGLTNQISSPDLIAYFSSLIPFSNRFFDSTQQINFYNSIANHLVAIDISSGQGTAFNIILESVYSYGFPLFFLAFVKLIYIRFIPLSESRDEFLIFSKIFLIFLLFNFVRNGFTVTASIFKLYFTLFLFYSILRGLRFILFSSTISTVISEPLGKPKLTEASN